MKTVLLPNWLVLTKLQRIFGIIQNHKGVARLVGGCVRDILAGVPSQDIDIATTLTPQSIAEIFSAEGIQVVPTGIEYGTVTLVLENDHFEVTSLRSDIKCFGRKAKVKFTKDWQQDASRRDFTINALYMDLDGKLYDYFEGIKDLEQRLVRFIGSPDERLREDYLRCLRYFRFISYFGNQNLHKESFDAVSRAVPKLTEISGERLHQEFVKIFSAEYNNQAVALMHKCKVFNILFDNQLTHLPKLNYKSGFLPNFTAIIALMDESEISEISKIKLRLKLSNAEADFIKNALNCLGNYTDTGLFYKTICYKQGLEFYKLFIEILEILGRSTKHKVPLGWTVPQFPIKAQDLKLQGKELGEALKVLEKRWVESEFSLNRQELLEYYQITLLNVYS